MKMKSSGWLVMAAGLAVVGLSGCATTAASGSEGGSWAATGPNTAILKSPAKDKVVVKADTKENFEAVVAAIHKQMQPGGRWQYIKVNERSTIDGSFADMRILFDKFGSVAKMGQPARQRLFADQTTINAILTKRDGDRLICQSQTPVGSHLPVKTCRTYAQLEAQRRHAQDTMRQLNAEGNRTVNSKSLGSGGPS